MGVERLGTVDNKGGKLLVELLKSCFRETSTNVANCLVFVGVGVVCSEKESTVHGSTFATSIVSTQNDEIERVADTGKIVLLDLHSHMSASPYTTECDVRSYLQPVSTPLAGLISTLWSVQHLHH